MKVEILDGLEPCERRKTTMMDLEYYKQEEYEHGKRIAKNNELTKQELKDHPQFQNRILTMMRESAGYENTRHIAPTEMTRYHSGDYRRETEGSKERYEALQEEFWKGWKHGKKELRSPIF